MAEVKKAAKQEKMATRQAYGKALVEIGAVNKNLVVMDADLSKSTMTAEFAKVYPERFFNMGIAEQNLYAAACGLALSGKVVCASTFAMFAAGRAFEIIRNSIGYTHANVKICATHAGITVGEDGASHQTFEDIALMRTIPGMTVVNPSDGASAKELIRQVIDMEGPAYVRLGRAAVPVFYDEESASKLKLGKGCCIREGKDLTIITWSREVNFSMEAAEKLAAEGIDVEVLDLRTLVPIDWEAIKASVSKTHNVIIVSEEVKRGSYAGEISAQIAEELFDELDAPVERVCGLNIVSPFSPVLEDQNFPHPDDIVKAVKRVLNK